MVDYLKFLMDDFQSEGQDYENSLMGTLFSKGLKLSYDVLSSALPLELITRNLALDCF